MANAPANHDAAWRARFTFCTDRLHITPCTVDTAAALSAMIADRELCSSYLIGRCARGDRSIAASHSSDRADGRLNLALRAQGSGEVIGCIQFGGGRIGYFIARTYWGIGLGGEAVSAACRHLPSLLDVETIEATVLRENTASRRILERCGFSFAGLGTVTLADRHGQAALLRYRKAVASDTTRERL